MKEQEIKITIEIDGVFEIEYITDTTGSETSQAAADKIIAIVGESPLRKRTRT